MSQGIHVTGYTSMSHVTGYPCPCLRVQVRNDTLFVWPVAIGPWKGLCCPCMGDSQSSPQTEHNYLCREIAALYKDCHTTKLFSRARFCQMFTRQGPARYEVVGKFCTLSRGGGRKSKEHLAPWSVAWAVGQACTRLTTPPTSSLLPSLGGELINLDRRRRRTKHLITFSMRGGHCCHHPQCSQIGTKRKQKLQTRCSHNLIRKVTSICVLPSCF